MNGQSRHMANIWKSMSVVFPCTTMDHSHLCDFLHYTNVQMYIYIYILGLRSANSRASNTDISITSCIIIIIMIVCSASKAYLWVLHISHSSFSLWFGLFSTCCPSCVPFRVIRVRQNTTKMSNNSNLSNLSLFKRTNECHFQCTEINLPEIFDNLNTDSVYFYLGLATHRQVFWLEVIQSLVSQSFNPHQTLFSAHRLQSSSLEGHRRCRRHRHLHLNRWMAQVCPSFDHHSPMPMLIRVHFMLVLCQFNFDIDSILYNATIIFIARSD